MIFIFVSCFTCAKLAIDLYYEVIHDIFLLFFVFVKSRSYFVLLVFSKHAFMCLLSVSGIYSLIQSCCCLHQHLVDSSQVELFIRHFIVMGYFVTLSIFVLVCVLSRIAKKGVCQVLRNQELMYQNFIMYMLANHDQNIQSRFWLLKVCLCVKLKLSVLQDLMCKSAKLDRLKIRLDQSKLVQIVFLQNFQLKPRPI